MRIADSIFSPVRFSLARRRRGMKKSDLSREVGLSAKTISEYESGDSSPSEESLMKISKALNFPVEFFFGDDIVEPTERSASFRSFSRMTASQRDAALAAGAIAFLLSDWLELKFGLPKPDVPDLQHLDPEGAAKVLRQEWDLGYGPVRNMVHLLESKGIKVFSLVEDTKQVNAFSSWRDGVTPFVFLNTKKSAEASRFDAAHELGHLVLHRHGEAKGKAVETEANDFASAFLMPRDSMLAAAKANITIDDVIDLKVRWNVSAMAMVYRLHKIGLLTDWVYQSMCVSLSKSGFRTVEPRPARHEASQVLMKVLAILRESGIYPLHIARELRVPEKDVTDLLFGLAPVVLDGDGVVGGRTVRRDLRLVKG